MMQLSPDPSSGLLSSLEDWNWSLEAQVIISGSVPLWALGHARVMCTIHTSLYSAARAKGVQAGVTQRVKEDSFVPQWILKITLKG